MIVDSTCEVEERNTQTLQGVGVTSVSSKPGSSNLTITDTLQFLSNAELQCTCYDFRGFDATFPFLVCRHVVLRCPYTAQGINGTIHTQM